MPTEIPSYPPASDAERAALLQYIWNTPIAFGSWRGLKGLYKQVEADATNADPELLGALIGRMDTATLTVPPGRTSALDLGSGFNNTSNFLVRGSTAYALNGSGLIATYALDGTEPLKPKRLGFLRLKGTTRIVLCGDFLVAFGGSRLPSPESEAVIVDISDATNLHSRGSIKATCAGPIAAFGKHVFFPVQETERNGFAGMRVLSVTDPDNPAIVGEIAVPNASGVVLSPDGWMAAVAAGNVGFSWNRLPKAGGVRLIEVQSPTRPRQVGNFDLSQITCGALVKDILYIGAGDSLVIYDISNPARPQKRGTWKALHGRNVTSVAVKNGFAYVGQAWGGVAVVDVHDPAHPTVGETISPSGYNSYQSIEIVGDTLYTLPQYGSVEAWNLLNPAKPVRAGQPPSPQTMGYMKRRARRLLRGLGKANPGQYAALASQALRSVGTELDPARHWTAMDILFGGTTEWTQARHGRGGYKASEPIRRLRLRTREERFPAAWDAHPTLAIPLLTDTGTPWQAQEMAARVLRAGHQPLPTITDQGILKRWIASGSSLLTPLAVRAVSARVSARTSTDAVLAAEVFYRAGASVQRTLIPHLSSSENAKWRAAFASRLAELLPREAGKQGRFNRRALASVVFLAEQFPEQTSGAALLPLAPALVSTGRADFIALVAAAASRIKAAELHDWLMVFLPLTDTAREPIMLALEAAFGEVAIDNRLASALVLLPKTLEGFYGLAWRILAASATGEATLNALWTHLLDSDAETPALRGAMSSPYALGLLSRAGITTEMITERLNSRPFLVALLSPETFARLAQTTPSAVLLRLVAAMPDEQWARVRGSWLRNLREGVGLSDLWASLSDALKTDDTDRIAARIVTDADFVDALLGLEQEHVETVLAVRDPACATLLRRWAERHPVPFTRDSAALMTAATHPLPNLRAWALERVRAVGMGMPFALRLLESDVPASIAVGQEFFTNEPAGGSQELTYALALCDSPAKPVRRWGREYVRQRWESLPRADLYRALFENPDPEIQAFVATLLEENPTPLPEMTDFDRDVLRARNRGRRAKEAVKKRQDIDATLDVRTLLELARGKGTPRDAEWALSQLAHRALAGEKIEGFAVEGVAG